MRTKDIAKGYLHLPGPVRAQKPSPTINLMTKDLSEAFELQSVSGWLVADKDGPQRSPIQVTATDDVT